MLAWLIDKVRMLLLGAAIGGAVLTYLSWSDLERIRNVESNGVEATASIEGATRSQSRRGGTSYTLDLTWKDSKGAVRQAAKVGLSRTFADQIIQNGKLTRAVVRIKYLLDDESISPVLIEDADRREDQDASMLQAGIGVGAVGIVGSALMFALRRRRQSAAT
jgi:hypothetical protein